MNRRGFIKFAVAVLISSMMSGCAKRTGPMGAEKPGTIFEKARGLKKNRIFLIAVLSSPYSNQFSELFCRKVLGPWSDSLDMLENYYSKVPLAVCVSGPVVRRLAAAQEPEDIELPELITAKPEKLDEKQTSYLETSYGISDSTGSIIAGQIMECVSYYGSSLRNDPVLLSVIEKSSFTVEDKRAILDHTAKSIRDFGTRLKLLLDNEHIYEASTSLSFAHLGLLDDERKKTQILESMVNYKVWREDFPQGFVPKEGYIDAETIKQLNKTTVKWIVVSSTDNPANISYSPELVFADRDFFDTGSTTALAGYLSRRLKEGSRPFTVIADLENIDFLLSSGYLDPVDYDEYIARVKDNPDEPIALSTATFNYAAPLLNTHTEKIKRLLSEARKMVNRYRNSGRADLNILNNIQKQLLIAESGYIYDNYDRSSYERLFRQSLIEIYREVGIVPPAELFVPVSGPVLYQPDMNMESMLEVKCDGVASGSEWAGAQKVTVPVRDGSDLSEVYAGFDRENLYFMLKFSTSAALPDEAGLILGHLDAAGAALVPRGRDFKAANFEDFPISMEINWRREVPEKTIIYRTTGNERWEPLTGNYNVGYSSGVLEMSLPLNYLDVQPKKNIFFKAYTGSGIFPETGAMAITSPDFKQSRGIISDIDPLGDMYGPGNYKYPAALEELKGNYDFKRIEVEKSGREKIISVELAALDNPGSATLGFSLPLIDIYVDINRTEGLGRTSLLPGRNAYAAPVDAWEYCITLNGNEAAVLNTAGHTIGVPEVNISPISNTINIFIPGDIIEADASEWGIIPVILAYNGKDGPVEIAEDTGANSEEFRGRISDSDSNILDIIIPSGFTQKDVLGANRKGKAIELPALRKN